MNELQPEPFNSPIAPQQKPPSKTGQIIKIIIAIVLVVGGVAYYLGGGSIFPSLQMNNTATTTLETATTTTNEVAVNKEGWKTYRNEEYGFEFQFPVTAEFSYEVQNPVLYHNELGQAGGEGPLQVVIFDDLSKFHHSIHTGAFSHGVTYNATLNEWVIEIAEYTKKDKKEIDTAKRICSTIGKTSQQNIPYYHFGDGRSGRIHDAVFLFDKKIIIVRGLEGTESRNSLRFDNPQAVKTATCTVR